MKSKKKVFLTVLCAAALVVASVLGTMAYLTSKTGPVTNTFTVGNVKITLNEAKVDTAGVPVEGAARVTENDYKLIPGHTYTKDPTVHVDADSEESWLFVKVVDEIADIEDAKTVATQMADNGWISLGNGVYVHGDNNGTATPVAAGDYDVFGTFKVKNDVTDLNSYVNKTIKVEAYAVQADGFTTPADALAAAPAPWTI